ncbi:hypothetical protein E2C01_064097 [Portunus trituberculatus]|uniref:Uncharacterized protein n=1 Tax=Portunus trituberculatus TaxID=210409 RepID=A0A5B7HJY4_PORTR|nr:hypothetical protein [Portunus trituberculatus]
MWSPRMAHYLMLDGGDSLRDAVPDSLRGRYCPAKAHQLALGVSSGHVLRGPGGQLSVWPGEGSAQPGCPVARHSINMVAAVLTK